MPNENSVLADVLAIGRDCVCEYYCHFYRIIIDVESRVINRFIFGKNIQNLLTLHGPALYARLPKCTLATLACRIKVIVSLMKNREIKIEKINHNKY